MLSNIVAKGCPTELSKKPGSRFGETGTDFPQNTRGCQTAAKPLTKTDVKKPPELSPPPLLPSFRMASYCSCMAFWVFFASAAYPFAESVSA